MNFNNNNNMKTINFSKRIYTSLILVNFTIMIFGIDVIVRKDTQSDPPGVNIYSSLRTTSTLSTTTSTYDVPIYAYTDENTLTLSFDVLVRKMIIAVYNSNNMLMYQRQISTYTQTSLDIDMSSWESDDYTIRISYSNTNFVGEFTLE